MKITIWNKNNKTIVRAAVFFYCHVFHLWNSINVFHQNIYVYNSCCFIKDIKYVAKRVIFFQFLITVFLLFFIEYFAIYS